MDLEERVQLICKRPVEEVLTIEELKMLLQTKSTPVAYNGFEPSGPMHLGTGLLPALKIKDFTQAGVKYKILLATWHAKLNNKFGGDLDKIRRVAKHFIEGWRALGIDESMVEFVMADDLISQKDYWELLLKISERVTLSNVIRALPIMGRKESENLRFGSYIYPLMQVTDIFMLGADIAQLGMDQRKANVLAKEVGPALGLWSPVAVHHHLLPSLTGPTKMGFDENPKLDVQISSKMAKSKPESAIFIYDNEEEIRSKLRKAFCPEKQIENNPVIDYVKNLILRSDSDKILIERPSIKGGPVEVNLTQLVELYQKGEIHPLDLKNAVAEWLIKTLEPVRKRFVSEELESYFPNVFSKKRNFVA
ncbi:tyrosine--tRNA ligase [Candidatus Marsarchaeota G1 archaeon OSP_D]|jgi:tyrosyl-tRNA synthetase|uniref:tyrosine--tRNA ligase n=3 Tax=Candidatus Marsarchaeota group 1 TaxID=2203770 RepID=A0A2R6AAP8_9ARCH|nr:MAG: tyrosine--tRNA ligase [Candidatus Marsarchaeota G1 archaeon OSP_D]PSN88276.1 MAG: tyrosine--tRNA ligase [Candidatus Marsarchaeota G1 archaeon OSP_C]